MEKILPIHLQEVIFSSSDQKISRQISKLAKSGTIRKITSRIYTPNFSESAEVIIRRNLFTILGKLYPGALLSHRSALEFKPTSTGNIFLTYSYTKKIKLPGVTLRILEGPGPIDGDNQFTEGLYVSHQERALLENLQVSKRPGPESKTVTLPEIEKSLEEVINLRGETGLNKLRDKVRIISEKLEMKSEFEKLNKLISALLTTHPSSALTSPLAIARALGYPYDPKRLELFELLFTNLNKESFSDSLEKNTIRDSYRNFAFFEAYFSNYIEGTEFELEEAKEIIKTKKPLPAREEDSHDILGTYKLVSNRKEMQVTPTNHDELLNILLYRHEILLGARKSKNPGQFKDKNNRAGETHFVDHNLVKGTLIKGFDFYQVLKHPLAKAAYIMFLVSEVHPFLDGNGRLARVMMNAELTKAKQSKIIIPTVFRDDYLLALRRLTRRDDPSIYIRMLRRANEFSKTIKGDDMDKMQNKLELSNAFKEPGEGTLKII